MKYLVFIIVIIISQLFNFQSYSQDQNAEIKNLDMTVVNNKVIITYDIVNFMPEDTFTVRLNFADKDLNFTYPKSLAGDIGMNVTGGNSKRIEWDIFNDQIIISEKLEPNLSLNGIAKYQSEGGGPSNVFLSFLIPGLGDYYVADTKKMKIKPYVRTISSLGLITMGLVAGINRNPNYTFVPAHEELYVIYTPRRKEMHRWVEEQWVEDGTDYWLFKGDKEVFIGIGAVIWVTDIFWVYIKGSLNRKFNSQNHHFNIGYNQHHYELKYCFNF